MVTHNLEMAAESDRVVRLAAGRVADPPTLVNVAGPASDVEALPLRP
jgi:hypothetical protein